MTAELLPITEQQTCQEALLDLAAQLCYKKLGNQIMKNFEGRLDQTAFRSYMYTPPFRNGLVVVARYTKEEVLRSDLVMATYDFIEPDFPLRIQVRAEHPAEYYDNEFYEDRVAEVTEYLDKSESVYAQSFYWSSPELIKA